MSQSDFVSRGQALVAAGQYQEAVKVCRLGLLGRPTTVEGRVVLGQALLMLKRFDEVLAEMRLALELDHSSVPAQVLRAEALLRKGDTAPAIEALHAAMQASPGDPHILQLLAEAEHGPQRPSVAHPAVGFVGSGDTKHYPGHPSGDPADFSDGFTQPTALQSPGSARRSSRQRAAVPFVTPSPEVLAVGDRSGTVEVDPDLEGVEMGTELDFDDLAAPPPKGRDSFGGASTIAGKQSANKSPAPAPAKSKKTPTIQLDPDSDDDIDLADTMLPPEKKRPAGPGTAVRNAVGRPSGVLGEHSEFNKLAPPPAAPSRSKPASLPPPAPAQFSQTLHAPGGAPVRQPDTVAPLPPAPRPVAAALPTMAAAQPRPPAQMPTMAVAPPHAGQQQLFSADPQSPAWARATVAAAPDPRSVAASLEPTARPGELDPAILALMSGHPGQGAAAAPERVVTAPATEVKTGIRRERSRLKLAVWIVIGIAVIGGGVGAGVWMRHVRLQKQIVAARASATDLAKTDTLGGWTKARASLARIVEASDTAANRAALARARALIAYELGVGFAEAKTAAEQAGTGLDASIAQAFVALATNDAKAAKTAADAAIAVAPDDPEALYVAGEAALLVDDAAIAVKYMKGAFGKDPRPFHGIGLARAQAAAYNWDEAIAALDKVLAAVPDHPGAVIARGTILATSGRITPSSALGNEAHAQLERIIAEGTRPIGEQQHGISSWQVAFANLALAQVDFARGDLNAARNAIFAAAKLNLDDQRFAETALETLYLTGDLVHARSAADNALKAYPSSRRVRVALAQILLAQGRAADVIDLVGKADDLKAMPDALAVRGSALAAAGDPANAAADFDAALKKVPSHEPALVGRAWLELAGGDVESATKRIAEHYSPKGSSVALTTVYAATLRYAGDAASREKAKDLLEKLVVGPPSVEMARAQLELGRIYRELGKINEARSALAEASRTGGVEARLESALLAIETGAPSGGREAIDALLKEAGDRPLPQLVIEGARARMLDGDHTGAAQLLELANKMPTLERWKVDRERGRLALRKSDFATAAQALSTALDTCGTDAETFFLAADAASAMPPGPLVDKVKSLAATRLKGRPEASIIDGKLFLLAEKLPEAEAAYRSARDALKQQGATARRLAQADFGIALVAYGRQNLHEAQTSFDVVMNEDPSIVDAYVFLSAIVKDPKRAFDYAKKATQLNPDYPYAWLAAGKLASKLGDKRFVADAIGRLQTIAPTGDELKELRKLR